MNPDDLNQYVTKRAIIEQLDSPFGTHYRVITSDGSDNGVAVSDPMDSEASALRVAAKHLGAESWVKARIKKGE